MYETVVSCDWQAAAYIFTHILAKFGCNVRLQNRYNVGEIADFGDVRRLHKV